MSDADYIKRILERERKARKQAERILEEKSQELFASNGELKRLNISLEEAVASRTSEIEAYAEQLRILFDEHPFPMFVYRVSSLKIIAVNETAVEHYNYSKEEFLDMVVPDLLPEDQLITFQSHLSKVVAGENLVREWQHIRKNGDVIDVEISARSIIFDNEPARLLLIKDITEIKNAQLAIRRGEERYHDLFENASDMIQSIDEEGNFLFVNKAWREKLGYTNEEISLLKFIDVIHDSEKSHCQELFREVTDCGRQFLVKTSFVTKDGKKIVVEGNVNCQLDSFTAQKHTRGIFRDVTVQREIEFILQENEKKYRELVETVSDIIYRCNDMGEFTYVNPTAEHICGYAISELVGQNFTFIIREDYKARVAEFYANQAASKTLASYLEFPIRSKNGSEIWIGQTVNIHFLDESKQAYEFIALARDITERISAQEALRRSEEKYRSIIENLELGLLEVDMNNIITNAYPKFCELSGYKRSELIGKSAMETLLSANQHELMIAQNRARESGKPGVYEVQLKRADGSLVWVIISGAPYYDHEGKVAGSVGIHLDISERKSMEAELLIAKETAENSMRSKELFMANMSHEIRTPMNAIIGMGELLRRSNLDAKQNKYLNAIQTSAQNLLVIINDILDFSKIESGKMDLEELPVDLNVVVKNAIDTVSLRADQKGINLIFNTAVSDGIYYMDPTRLSQVFINLLSNAVKFTKEGEVEFTASIVRRGPIIDQVFFCVADTGIGIPPEKLERIFESFVQADETTARKYGGTGLGLPISKKLVELMGGELSIKSKVNEGSQFYFVLDLKKATALEDSIDSDSAEENQLKGIRVLLAEDHEINRFMAMTILEEWECLVEVATNGIEAIEKVMSMDFDVVLMDMRMPELDGLGATFMIREKLKSKVPIIALTANAIVGDSEKCLEAGMNDYISKPFLREELYRKMLRQIQLGKSLVEVSKTKQTLATEKSELVDLSRLEKTVNGNDVFMKKLIQLFLDDAPNQIQQIKSYLNENNVHGVASIAHRIKPSLDGMASLLLQNQVREIEAVKGPMTDEMKQNSFLFCSRLELLLEQLKTRSTLS
jgi:PAS domain S-box-containing protein